MLRPPQEHACLTAVTSHVTDTLGSHSHLWEVLGWERGNRCARSPGLPPCSSSSGSSPRLLPGAFALQVPVGCLRGFFLRLFLGDPFGEVLQELVVSLEMRCTWLFSKEMLPGSSSVLETHTHGVSCTTRPTVASDRGSLPRRLAPAWSSLKSLLFPPLFYQRFLCKCGALWQQVAHSSSFTVCPTAVQVQLQSQR